jgi:hypothetical protein
VAAIRLPGYLFAPAANEQEAPSMLEKVDLKKTISKENYKSKSSRCRNPWQALTAP